MTRHMVSDGSLALTPGYTPIPALPDPVRLVFRPGKGRAAATQFYVHLDTADEPCLGLVMYHAREDGAAARGRPLGDSEIGWSWNLEGERHNVSHDIENDWMYEKSREAVEALLDTWPLYARLNGLPTAPPEVELPDLLD